MKFVLWCLAIGLEVWVGVFAILMGLFTLMSIVALPGEFEAIAGIALTTVGSTLVADAVRRELRSRAIRKMEALGSPLDSPTQV